jgi:uncharacterized protein YceH (UPF0502 family)
VDPLHPIEVRVLGALLEKDLTTPEYYPLTLNALQNACNQKSSREPVMALDEAEVSQAIATLGHRVEKYGHRLGETLNLGRRELALLCVLMLRGAQTVGELRGRTERMHEFSDMDEVERVLESLSAREPALVAPAARGRWAHTWHEHVDSPEPASAAPTSPGLAARVETLERELAELKQKFEDLRRQFE